MSVYRTWRVNQIWRRSIVSSTRNRSGSTLRSANMRISNRGLPQCRKLGNQKHSIPSVKNRSPRYTILVAILMTKAESTALSSTCSRPSYSARMSAMFRAGSDRVEHNQHRDQVLTFCAMITAPTRLHMLMSVIFPSFLSTVAIPYRIYPVFTLLPRALRSSASSTSSSVVTNACRHEAGRLANVSASVSTLDQRTPL